MKFNEKLIELRKKEGLSQEELGYKLNVTRQTVSKWELGQTTPEMDKLVELSKMFNISVDELINDSEVTTNVNPIIEDQPIENGKEKGNNKVLFIIVGLLIVVIVVIVVRLFSTFTATNMFDKVTGGQTNSLFDKVFSLFDKVIDSQVDNEEDMMENSENMQDVQEDMKNIFENATNKINSDSFNSALEIYAGSNKGMTVTSVLDKIITSNKTEERKITVQYNGKETQDENEIKNIKRNFRTFDDCEITYEYDTDGFINKAIIEKL